jgi:hypothetical protein
MKTRYGALLLVLSVLMRLAQADIYVDDNAPGDPLPFDRQISDPNEDGSAAHPFDSVQEAIEAAQDGDTIIVAPGHYLSPDPWIYDEISFKGKTIRLVSSAPTDFGVAEQTVLCGVVIFNGTEDPNCLLQGFKIQNHTCGGILGNGTKATIANCIISGNGPCGATVVKDIQGPVSNCLITDNTTFHGCDIQPVVSGCPQLLNCTIANNVSGISLHMSATLRNSPISVRNCIVCGNVGSEIVGAYGRSPLLADVSYCLIEDWSTWNLPGYARWTEVNDYDPCFVQPGYWGGEPASYLRNGSGESIPLYPVGTTLVEGDYHLRSEGYRWSEREIHGSHWYYDFSTSSAIDAGDPMDSLGEELERAPDDPEGRWGVNHAIDLGAYGGTAQASLAPNRGRPLGVAGVDFSDYWPFIMSSVWSLTDPRDGGTLQITVVGFRSGDYPCQVYTVQERSGSMTRNTYWAYIDGTLYVTGDAGARDLLPQITEKVLARYPQYLTIRSTVETPFDPFDLTTPALRSTIVMRGTLAEVIAGTGLDMTMFADGNWHDVIAFREQAADGAPGRPITIFARGFGPLMLGGQPVMDAPPR